MTGIGIGVGVGLGSRVRMSPGALLSGVSGIVGAKAIDQFVGEQSVASGGTVTSWPGATLTLANTLTATVRTSHNGRTFVSSGPSATCNMSTTTPTAMVSLVLVVYHSALAAGLYHFLGLTSPRSVGRDFLLTYGTAFVGANTTTYVNGAASSASIADAVYVLEGECPINASTGLQLWSQEGGANNATGLDIGYVLPLSSALTAGERTSLVALLRRYYRA